MKFSTIRTDKTGEHLSQWEFTKFVKRIRTDANDNLITTFREEATPDSARRFHRFGEIPRVYAAVELRRQKNGAVCINACNGIVVLEVRQLMSGDRREEVKRAAFTMPSTLATFTGATGTEVIILVSVARHDGTWPGTESEAETFYAGAYQRAARIYDGVLPVRITRMEPSLRHAFLLPLDATPLVRDNASPITVTEAEAHGQWPSCDGQDAEAHLLALPEQRDSREMDYTAYQNYERAYVEALDSVGEKLHGVERGTPAWYATFVTAMATLLAGQGWPEEETVCHLWRHLGYNDDSDLTEDFVRTLVTSAFAQVSVTKRSLPSPAQQEPLMQKLIRRMESRYLFRRNTVMGYAEYRTNHTWVTSWRPVTEQVINTFTTDLQLAGLNVWDRDVRRYVNSTRVRDYNPVSAYLTDNCSHWDGRDHIRALAATVPTDNAAQWGEWFHTWFLAMVAQWLGYDRRYGNAIVPLLISDQGMHKSAFCRSLLPPELRKWGYSDNLSLAEERPVHLAMSQMLLINLDEFNRISPAKQEGFLKNILQLPTVKVKRPYASHTEEVPRLASFIATTNVTDVLTDPTGSRRFIGVQVTGNIDVSQTPNHAQLFAQARAELDHGARYWFDDTETRAIMAHNRRFQQRNNAEMFFHQFFATPAPSDKHGSWMTTTAILLAIKQRAGAAFQMPSANKFGRILRGIPDIQQRHSIKGSEFLVQAKENA